MSLTATPPLDLSASPSDDVGVPRRRLWTREEYYRAADVGLFGPEERLELIKGEVICKVSPQGVPHAVSIRKTEAIFEEAFDDLECAVFTRMPITLPDDSEPEPDVLVVRGSDSDYEENHPTPEDVLPVIEVSDSTVRFDRGDKANLYAGAGIPDYWMLNLPQRRLEVRRNPVDGEYRTTLIFAEGDTVSSPFAPQASIPVTDLLPSSAPPPVDRSAAADV